MNIKKLNEAISNLQDNADTAVLISSIISIRDGQSLAGINTDSKFDALLSKFTSFSISALTDTKVGSLRDYYAVKATQHGQDLFNIVLISGDYCWAIMFDLSSVSIGMIMNAIIPSCMSDFKEALR